MVAESDCEGVDTVYTSVDYTAPDYVENVTAIGDCAVNLAGNCLDNELTGNDADNVIKGEAGNDTLHGKGGNDTLYGGDGNDEMTGGAGNNLLNGGDGDDSLYGDTGNDRIDGGNGNDFLNGHEGNDILTGGVGNDGLWGWKGNDIYVMSGAFGHDTIGAVGSDTNDFNNSDDKIVFAGISHDQITASRQGYSLLLKCGEENSVEIMGWNIGKGYELNNFSFSDGQWVSLIGKSI